MITLAPISREASTVCTRWLATVESIVGTPVMSITTTLARFARIPRSNCSVERTRTLGVQDADDRQDQQPLAHLQHRRGELANRLLLLADDPSRQHGSISLRDIEVASGQTAPSHGDARSDDSRINAAFGVLSLEELMSLRQSVGRAMSGLKGIDAKMRSEIGTEAAPGFDPLSIQLAKIDKVLQAQVAARPGGAAAEPDAGESGAAGVGQAVGGGFIRSRDEAIRALEAVAEYFRRYEPSSPVPFFCDRAKGLVSRDFSRCWRTWPPRQSGRRAPQADLRQE